MNLLVIMDLDGYVTYCQGGFPGHLSLSQTGLLLYYFTPPLPLSPSLYLSLPQQVLNVGLSELDLRKLTREVLLPLSFTLPAVPYLFTMEGFATRYLFLEGIVHCYRGSCDHIPPLTFCWFQFVLF